MNEMKTIYVGNLPFDQTEDDIRELFSQYGTVHSVKVVMDRVSGRSKGFGFVEMDQQEAEAAIQALDGSNFGGRDIRVNEARERKPRRNDNYRH